MKEGFIWGKPESLKTSVAPGMCRLVVTIDDKRDKIRVHGCLDGIVTLVEQGQWNVIILCLFSR
jgi:hypothetical protein